MNNIKKNPYFDRHPNRFLVQELVAQKVLLQIKNKIQSLQIACIINKESSLGKERLKMIKIIMTCVLRHQQTQEEAFHLPELSSEIQNQIE